MFRCQFSNEVSDGAVFQFLEVIDEETKHKKRVWSQVKAAEKPETIVVQMRKVNYTHYLDDYGRPCRQNECDPRRTYGTEGTEIVRELKVRAKYVEKVKELIANGQPLTHRPERSR